MLSKELNQDENCLGVFESKDTWENEENFEISHV